MITEQVKFWKGDFGKEYTDRNTFTHDELNKFYKANYGVSKDELNKEFLGSLDRKIKILEIGCNLGQQLSALQNMGFKNLVGLDLQPYAIEKARQRTKNINFFQGSGFEIPFKDGEFDLVYTHGVLIHIHPNDLAKIMEEMIRVSSKYLWGFEYYNEELKQLNYRGHEGFMWKRDFCKEFEKQNPNLKVVKKKIYAYVTESNKGNSDCMYLLSK